MIPFVTVDIGHNLAEVLIALIIVFLLVAIINKFRP